MSGSWLGNTKALKRGSISDHDISSVSSLVLGDSLGSYLLQCNSESENRLVTFRWHLKGKHCTDLSRAAEQLTGEGG